MSLTLLPSFIPQRSAAHLALVGKSAALAVGKDMKGVLVEVSEKIGAARVKKDIPAIMLEDLLLLTAEVKLVDVMMLEAVIVRSCEVVPATNAAEGLLDDEDDEGLVTKLGVLAAVVVVLGTTKWNGTHRSP